jgi:hypothetical protein
VRVRSRSITHKGSEDQDFLCTPTGGVADPDPGTGDFLPQDLGSGIWDEHPGSYSESLEAIFVLKIPVLNFFDADPDPGSF